MAGVQSTGQWGMNVAPGKGARSSFTVEGPQPLDPEDLPDEVSAVNSSLGSLFQIVVHETTPVAEKAMFRHCR